MSSSLQRITAWLCLVATVLTGIAPARGFALCLEADGCVSIELKVDGESCVGCEDHESEGLALAPDGEDGPCVDLALPWPPGDPQTSPDASSPLERIAFGHDLCSAAPPIVGVVAPIRVAHASIRCAPSAERPPAALALIRSVLLLV